MAKSLQILVADDDRETADVLGAVLAAHFGESRVSVAYGGRAAVALALQQRPDAAVLELQMPELDGEGVAGVLRAEFPDDPPLLIALSGAVLRLQKLRQGDPFDHLLSKPTDIEKLVGLLSSLS
ncbi:response regulator [Variovorax paradoxus]|nr:response regulator [Variovorax paradoxus]